MEEGKEREGRGRKGKERERRGREGKRKRERGKGREREERKEGGKEKGKEKGGRGEATHLFLLLQSLFVLLKCTAQEGAQHTKDEDEFEFTVWYFVDTNRLYTTNKQ